MTFRSHKVFHTLIRSYFSPKETTAQKYIYTGSYDGSIYVFDILTGKVAKKLDGHHATIRDVSWHPFLPILISTSWDGTVKKWDYDPELERSLNKSKLPSGKESISKRARLLNSS